MNLNNSEFFEHRLMNLIQKITTNQDVRPINGFEMEILKNKSSIQKINEEYNYSLYRSLKEYSKFINIKHAVIFLLQAEREDKTLNAKDIMDWSVTEQSTMDLNQLQTSLKNYDNMPTSFLPSLYGDYNEDGRDRDNHNIVKGSSIDLNRLREFK